jgi:Tol biopolymer transport system component
MCLALGLAGALPAYAQNTTTKINGPLSGNTYTTAVSADGRYVGFISEARVVLGDTNGLADAHVYDRLTGVTERVSLGLAGTQALGGDTFSLSLSADGRFVAMASSATNLVLNDTNGVQDVFVRDRLTGTTTRVSVPTSFGQAAGASGYNLISADGRYVVFTSTASNLVAGDTNGHSDIFRRDRATGTTIRVSIAHDGAQANHHSSSPSMSADGQVIAFESSATNLVPSDTNDREDTFVRDLQTGVTVRVSIGPGGIQADERSLEPSISGDGRFVAFTSRASNLIAGGGIGIYLHDRQNGATSALSTRPPGTFEFDAPHAPVISANGRHVCYTSAFVSPALFLVDRQTLAKTRIDVATNGDAANFQSLSCAASADATILAFVSAANNLVDGDVNGTPDVFVRTNFPTMALDRTALTFAAVTSGTAFVSQTAAQQITLTASGSGTSTWTAVADQPWLQVSPASGAGSGTLSISVAPAAGLPSRGTVTGTIVVSLTGAVNALPPIAVSLTLSPIGTAVAPFGVVDTPTDDRNGVTGAIPFTGWALDDVEVTRVSICRAGFGSEVAPVDPNCGGAAEIFVGFATFIDGARPDVAGAFPAFPLATRGGWGFMVLTNMLPDRGNGRYQFTIRAQDREGTWGVLGTRTMTCANASGILPFGTIDTPSQGAAASGSSYVNFGWALTPQPKAIPIDGSTIQVLVDGVSVGNVDYNHARADIQALFPGFQNTNGAVGFHILDTTLMTNGLHTISWTVTDDQGRTEGLGSRFFTVSNSASAVTAAPLSAPSGPVDLDTLPADTTPLVGRRGWDLETPYGLFHTSATGMTMIRSEEVNRVELQLPDGDYSGYLRTPAGFAPLPIGSRLDSATNTFTWAPGVGFVGRYDFAFVRSVDGRALSRRDVRIVLYPKGRGTVGPQVVIDAPRAGAAVSQPFVVGGWALDLDAVAGTGVTTLHAWAYPAGGGVPIFIGATAYGGSRPDVAAIHGERFKDSGFNLIAQGLPAGDYNLAVFAWSTETMGFIAPKIVRISVTP